MYTFSKGWNPLKVQLIYEYIASELVRIWIYPRFLDRDKTTAPPLTRANSLSLESQSSNNENPLSAGRERPSEPRIIALEAAGQTNKSFVWCDRTRGIYYTTGPAHKSDAKSTRTWTKLSVLITTSLDPEARRVCISVRSARVIQLFLSAVDSFRGTIKRIPRPAIMEERIEPLAVAAIRLRR